MSGFANTIDVLGDDAVIDSIIQRTITEFYDDEITHVGSSAFSGCSHLTTVSLPSAEILDTYAFMKCLNLETLCIPAVTQVNNSALREVGCVNLRFDSLDRLEINAIRFSESLELIDMPKVSYIGGYSLDGCEKLEALIVRSPTVCAIASSSLTKTAISKGNGYIYVPRDLLPSYKEATNWSVYADQFRAIEDYTVDGTVSGELDETKI